MKYFAIQMLCLGCNTALFPTREKNTDFYTATCPVCGLVNREVRDGETDSQI